jgi:aquaporin Z
MGVGRGVYYIVAQLVGATVAALALKVIFAPAAAAAVNLGTPAVGLGVGTGAAVLAEIIMTFFLMYSVFGVAVDQRGAKAIAGLVIGLTITMDIFVGGGLTGAAMNPARWFGPAIIQGAFDNWWIYWVGPIVGASIAAVVWNQFYLSDAATSLPHAGSAETEQTESGQTAPRRIAA